MAGQCNVSQALAATCPLSPLVSQVAGALGGCKLHGPESFLCSVASCCHVLTLSSRVTQSSHHKLDTGHITSVEARDQYREVGDT